ncbi:uncharacterized protein LOC143616890 [Bidens hawaiensis]|uniref:uncharacterized protein LOC143616890 n=1 Tax=Bidens hawaiensis TaxID=980011 RepID=UPI00404A63BF
MVPPAAKRLKPPPPDQDQTQLVHCPRCESPNTKFCYYNNYSLTQPRYFCKACRRYWTKGGTLRNIPVGGVSRRNKKLTFNRRREQNSHYDKLALLSDGLGMSPSSISLQLSRPESPVQFSENPDFMFEDLTIDFMDRGGGGGIRNYNGADYFQSTAATGIGGYRPNNGYGPDTSNIYGPGPFGETMWYFDERYDMLVNGDDVKPKVFDLERRDQAGCYSDLHDSGVGRNGSPGYLLGLGSAWTGLVHGYGSASTNPLV